MKRVLELRDWVEKIEKTKSALEQVRRLDFSEARNLIRGSTQHEPALALPMPGPSRAPSARNRVTGMEDLRDAVADRGKPVSPPSEEVRKLNSVAQSMLKDKKYDAELVRGPDGKPVLDEKGKPRVLRTYCNLFVADYAQEAFHHDWGLHKTATQVKQANEIVDFLAKKQEGWEPIHEHRSNDAGPSLAEYKEAQEYANKGYLVIIGWKNPAGGDGHVAVVVPGDELVGPNSFGFAPTIAQAGKSKLAGESLSLGFVHDQANDLVIYYHKP
ncbi:MAG TPA: hypothetical protein VG457_01565 [Planctomycetota bacterium]|nr:hypothetical protein [Planctomycetota bacterium]